jgi:preprotein translocase subunit YajC
MFESLNSWATSLAGQMLLWTNGAMHWANGAMLFADAAKPEGAGGEAQGQPVPGFMNYLPMIAIAVLGYFLLIRPQSKQAAQLREQISALKSGDKVVTKSGIYGTVMNVDTQKNRMTLKIDEANNTKIDIVLSSIDYVVDDKVKETVG